MKSISIALLLLPYTWLWSAAASQEYGSYGNDGDYGGDYANDGETYQDYADPYSNEDSLYADYAEHQQAKEMGANTGAGVGMGKLLLASSLSWMIGGKFHSGRVAKKTKQKFQKEQKALYAQYYNDVYKLSEQKQQLQLYIEELKQTLQQTEAKHELEALQRDYDEFKQPDIDGDDRISRAEFNMYVKNYLSNYPGLTEADYPKFEDFDHDGDGFVSFEEYAKQMALQAQKADEEAAYGGQETATQKALNDLYQDAAQGYKY